MRLNYIDNCDCLEGLKQMPDNSVDLVVTDPPYQIGTRGAGMYKTDILYTKELEFMADGFREEILDEICRVLKRINVYIFCSQKQLLPLLDYFVIKRKCNWNLLTWHKSNPVPACGNKYITDTEYILFFRERGVRVGGEASTKKTYYITPTNTTDKKRWGHPTVKPIEIVQNLIINSSNPGDLVLDPFMGSGTTAVAAIKTGRNFFGFEMKEEYHATAQQRIAEAVDQMLQEVET